MNQPATALTIEALNNSEAMALNSLRAITSAIGNNLLMGFTIHAAPGPEGETVVPAVTLLFHGEEPLFEPRKLMLTVPKNGPNIFNLIAQAGEVSHMTIKEYHEKTALAADYIHECADIDRVRRNSKRRIIMPGSARN